VLRDVSLLFIATLLIYRCGFVGEQCGAAGINLFRLRRKGTQEGDVSQITAAGDTRAGSKES